MVEKSFVPCQVVARGHRRRFSVGGAVQIDDEGYIALLPGDVDCRFHENESGMTPYRAANYEMDHP